MTCAWLDAIEHSWLLKLVRLCAPYIPITAIALNNHAETGAGSGLIAALPALVVFGGLAIPFAIGQLALPAKKARRRALSPLQRMQMSEEADVASLDETLGIATKPPIGTLPDLLQAAIAHLGVPLPRLLATLLAALGMLTSLTLMGMAIMEDPLRDLSRWTGLSLPLAYWPTYSALLTLLLLIALWHWLRQMHDHYVTEAKAAGRRPFPALRS